MYSSSGAPMIGGLLEIRGHLGQAEYLPVSRRRDRFRTTFYERRVVHVGAERILGSPFVGRGRRTIAGCGCGAGPRGRSGTPWRSAGRACLPGRPERASCPRRSPRTSTDRQGARRRHRRHGRCFLPTKANLVHLDATAAQAAHPLVHELRAPRAHRPRRRRIVSRWTPVRRSVDRTELPSTRQLMAWMRRSKKRRFMGLASRCRTSTSTIDMTLCQWGHRHGLPASDGRAVAPR